MFINQIDSPVSQANLTASNHLLGAIAMICAPMLFIGSFFYSKGGDAPNPQQFIASLCGVVYLGGIAAGAVGMRRLRVTGKRTGAAILFAVQLVGLLLAAMFDVSEFAAPQLKETVFFFVCDMAYPFSHVLMIVVGIAIWRAGVWCGWRRVPPFLCGLALPLFFAASATGGEIGFTVFPVLVTTGFFLIGYAVYTGNAHSDFEPRNF